MAKEKGIRLSLAGAQSKLPIYMKNDRILLLAHKMVGKRFTEKTNINLYIGRNRSPRFKRDGRHENEQLG
ncbi:MAG: hypothetical protein NTW71_12750 [Deltaproteobacteria bacterium]|nr:hypothetical protein [Deltaproteobacteria bacterium]